MNTTKLAMIATAACLLAAPAALAQSRTDPAGTTKANGMTPDSTKPGSLMATGSSGAMKSGGAMTGSESGVKSAGSGNGTGTTERGGTKN